MTNTASAAAVSWRTESLDSPVDGVPIRFAALTPRRAPAQAVLFLNGRSEWIEKYTSLIERFDLGDDTLWLTMDHRGQGASGGPRAFVPSYDHYAADAAAVLNAAAPDLPYGLVCHSMGGLVALYGTLQGILHPRALALSSPLFALPNVGVPQVLVRPIVHFMAKTRYSQQPTGFGRTKTFPHNALTSSWEGFNTVRQSPYPFVSPTFGWIAATLSAFESVHDPKKLMALMTPIRILGGRGERYLDPEGWTNWCRMASGASPAPIEFHRIDGRHELLNEIPRVRQEAIRLLRGWLERHLLRQDPE